VTDFPIAVHVSEAGWQEVFADVQASVARAVAAGAAVLERVPTGELSVALVSDQEIAELNARYRDKTGPTNVLSFPSVGPDGGPAPVQGDIVVALQTVLREAGKRGIAASDHATHLLVHGFLHLQGYDHLAKDDADVMEALEIRALDTVGIADPYLK